MLTQRLRNILILASSACFCSAHAGDFSKAQEAAEGFLASPEGVAMAQTGKRATTELRAALARHPALAQALTAQGLRGLATAEGQRELMRPLLEKGVPLLERNLQSSQPTLARYTVQMAGAYLDPAPGAMLRETGRIAQDWLSSNGR